MGYLKYWDVVLPPPLPALIAVGMTAALFGAGSALASRLGRPRAVHAAAAFALVVGLAASAVHALAWAGFVRLDPLRLAGWALAVGGWLWIGRHATTLAARARGWRDSLAGATRLEWAAAALAAVVALGFVLAALGPPTDADSLDYHLGTAMEWLRTGGTVRRDDWLHFRLAGTGEALLALGLAAGTDALGATLQVAALLTMAWVVLEAGDSPRARMLGLLLVLGAPLLLFLAPNQKPQLMPGIAVVVAGLVALEARDHLGPADALLSAGALFAGVACKYSLILPGLAAAGLLVAAAHRSRALTRSLIPMAVAFAVLAMPLYLRNWLTYGDPLTPFLERFRGEPSPNVVAFAAYLREAGARPTAASMIRLPLDLIVPPGMGAVSTVLGVGVLAFIPAFLAPGRRATWLLLAAAGATGLVLVAGQIAARFFLEPYLWAAVAAVDARDTRARRWLFGGLAAQIGVTVGLVTYAAASLFPGALAAPWREAVMLRASYGYAEARWMDATLPEGGHVLSHIRSVALVPRPFVGLHAFGDAQDRRGSGALARAVATGGITAVTVREPVTDPRMVELLRACGVPLGSTLVTRDATRNPFNRGTPYSAAAFAVAPDRVECRAVVERLRRFADGSPP